MEKPVTFRSERQQIVGMLHIPERRPPWQGVVFCHGFTGHKAESHFLFTRLARHLAAAGCAVLRFDFRGSGDSEGDFSSMTIPGEISDALSAISFLGRQRGISRDGMALVGLSMGGLISVFAASHPSIRKLAILSAVCFPKRLAGFIPRKLLRQMKERGSAYIPGMGLTLGWRFIETAAALDPEKEAEKFTGSVLIVHAKDDRSVPLDHSLAYFKAFHRRASSCELVVLQTGGHTYTTEEAEKAVISSVATFLS